MSVFYREDRGRWSYNFRLGRKRYAGYANEPDGTPCASRRAAERAEERERVAAEQSQRNGAPMPASVTGYTLAQGLALYAGRADKSKANWQNQVDYIADLVAFFGAEAALADIDEARIWEYIEWARQQPVWIWIGGPKAKPSAVPSPVAGRPSKHWKESGRTRSEGTINHYLVALRKTLGIAHKARDAMKRRLLEEVPEVPELKKAKRLPRPIGEDDVATLLQRAAPHVADAAALSLLMGFRRAEAYGLTIPHVDFDNLGVWLRAEETKSGRDEFLPANEPAMQLLTRLVAQARERGTIYLVTWRRGKKGKWLPIRNPKSAIRTAMKRAGLVGKHRFHDLKASFTTALAHVAPGRVVQQLARHQSFETTQLYLLVADSATRAAVDGVSGRRAIRDIDLTRPMGEVATKSTTKPRKRAAGGAGK